MYQQITLVGNLGKDPEMRYTTSQIPVTTFSLAVTRNWTNHEGERQEKTIWFRVVAWRKLAETASQYLTKGSKVLVVGQVEEPQTFTDREGKVRASLEVTADVIRFLNTRSDGVVGGGGAGGGAAAPSGTGGGGAETHDEDIPF